jgi:hypothetical protein
MAVARRRWAQPAVGATAGRGGGGAVTARGEAGQLDGRRRRRAGSVGRAAVAGGGRGRRWERRRAGRVEEKEVKGEKERREPVGRLSYLLCRVPAIRHSAKIFLKFKNKLCRVPDLGHSAKTPLPSASCRALGKDVFYRLCRVPTDRHSAKSSLPSANWTALDKVYFIF